MINAHSLDSSALAAHVKVGVRANDTAVNFRAPAVQPVDPIETSKPAAPLPTEDLAKTLDALFTQFDADGNGGVSRDELLSGLKAIGFSEEGSQAVASIVLSSTTDVDGDQSISRSELNRAQKIGEGDNFAYADLDNSGNVNEKELADAVDRYSKFGKVNREFVFNVFTNSDANKDGVLTRAEFELAGKTIAEAAAAPVPSNQQATTAPVAPTEPQPVAAAPVEPSYLNISNFSIEQIFTMLDGDKDGKITDTELSEGLQSKFGFNAEGVAQIKSFLAQNGIDTDNDGSTSLAESRRQVAKDAGDVFAFFDADNSGSVTESEIIDGALALGHNSGIGKAFIESSHVFDSDKDNIITKAEFEEAMKKGAAIKTSDVAAEPVNGTTVSQVAAAPAAPVEPQQVPTAPVETSYLNISNFSIEQIFTMLDGDKDGRITDTELSQGLQSKFGFNADGVAQIKDFLAQSGIDTDRDGSTSLAESRRQVAKDAGDVVAFFDVDNNGSVTESEIFDGALALGHNSSIGKAFIEASRAFDTNNDQIITKAEFEEAMKKNAPVKVNLSSLALSPALLEAQLAALLDKTA